MKVRTRRTIARGFATCLSLLLSVLSQAAPAAPIFYDWDSRLFSSSGFLQFDGTTITDPADFVAQPVVGGIFNFDDFFFTHGDPFPVLGPFDGISGRVVSNAFTASSGVLLIGRLKVAFEGEGGLFIIEEDRVVCESPNSVNTTCGIDTTTDPFNGSTSGRWVLRDAAPVPVPNGLLLLATSLIGVAVARRRYRSR